jgi:hypothetical protein
MRIKKVLTIVTITCCLSRHMYSIMALRLHSSVNCRIEEVKQSEAFDPVSFVDSVWDSRLYPTIMDEAVDISRF